jgi:hypothetical protein
VRDAGTGIDATGARDMSALVTARLATLATLHETKGCLEANAARLGRHHHIAIRILLATTAQR